MSSKFSFTAEDAKKVALGALVAAAGAALTYTSEWLAGQDFGAWTPTVVAVFSIAVNAFRKWATETQ